jgi:serine/threonine-protein kinase
MVTGVAPFTASSPVSVAYKHVRETPAPPSTLAPDLPGAMDRIVLTAMAKDVEARYASAQDLRADLLRFERGRPLVGAPVPVAASAATAATPVRVDAPVVSAPAAASVPPAAARRSRSRVGPAIAIGVVLALLVGFIVFLLANSDFGDSGDDVPTLDVPNVAGFSYDQAKQGLEALGFTVARQDVDEPEQAPNLVIGQDPEGGRKIPKGGLITLKTSSPNITMPDVVGQPRDQAAQTLAASNLAANFVEEDSDQPPGTVLRSDPAAGGPVAKLPDGSRPTVTVVVAREPLVAVPDVTALDPYAALLALQQAGLAPTVADTPSDTVPKGRVIGTDPPAGTQLARGTAVNLQVSTGSAQVPVPSMVGQPRATAEAVLHDQLGFGLTISFANAGPTKKGLVVSQNPTGGQAPRGSGIALAIGL